MSDADPMAASGQTNFGVLTEGHSLSLESAAPVASMSAKAAKNELQKFQITEQIQFPNPKTADLNSTFGKKNKLTAGVKNRRLRRVKALRTRGAQPQNQNAFKHGKYTRRRRALLAAIRAHIRHSRTLMAEITADPIAEAYPAEPQMPSNRGPKRCTRSRLQHRL